MNYWLVICHNCAFNFDLSRNKVVILFSFLLLRAVSVSRFRVFLNVDYTDFRGLFTRKKKGGDCTSSVKTWCELSSRRVAALREVLHTDTSDVP